MAIKIFRMVQGAIACLLGALDILVLGVRTVLCDSHILKLPIGSPITEQKNATFTFLHGSKLCGYH